MNTDQLGGLIRAVMGILGGFALKYGIDSATWVAITGGLVGIATAVWSFVAHTDLAAIKSVAANPDVTKVVVTDPLLAISIPSHKVVANDT